jgi:hypothetical protein
MGGTAQLLRAEPLVGEGDLVAAFNAARDDEYEEIVDRCRDFLAEIKRETAAEHFTYGELDGNDEDLTKLRGWFQKESGGVTNVPHRYPIAGITAFLMRC